MRWIVPPRYEANYMLVINSFHSSNQTKIWGVRKWWTTPLFSNQFDNTCTINCRVLFLRRHSMFFIKKGRKCLDTTKQNIQQPRASREIYTEVKKTKQSRPRLQTKPKRPREPMPANPALAHLRASSKINGASAMGWSAALSWIRRFHSFHNDPTTNRARESKTLR